MNNIYWYDKSKQQIPRCVTQYMSLVWYTIRSWVQSYVYHGLHICTVRWSRSVTIHYKQFIIFYYVREHELSPVIDAFHTTPITCVNPGPKLLKLISWRHCPCFMWVPYIPRTTAQSPGAEPSPTARQSITITMCQWQWQYEQYGMSVIPWNPAVNRISAAQLVS